MIPSGEHDCAKFQREELEKPVPVRVRPIRPNDAAAYVDLLAWLDGESRYPVVNIIERSMSAGDWRSAIDRLYAEGQRMIFVAEVLDTDTPLADTALSDTSPDSPQLLAGFLSTTSEWFGAYELRIVIGIREQYTGQGIGTRLFTALETWARSKGVHRLHLTVEVDNTRALALYHKMGFAIESHIPRAVQIEGRWVDDYVMAKRLGE